MERVGRGKVVVGGGPAQKEGGPKGTRESIDVKKRKRKVQGEDVGLRKGGGREKLKESQERGGEGKDVKQAGLLIGGHMLQQVSVGGTTHHSGGKNEASGDLCCFKELALSMPTGRNT